MIEITYKRVGSYSDLSHVIYRDLHEAQLEMDKVVAESSEMTLPIKAVRILNIDERDRATEEPLRIERHVSFSLKE